jgi:predicted nuclease with TOPRIM domain
MKEELIEKIAQNEQRLASITTKISNLTREKKNLEHKIQNQKDYLKGLK